MEIILCEMKTKRKIEKKKEMQRKSIMITPPKMNETN